MTGMATQPPPTRHPLADFAPKLIELTDDVLFGDVSQRPGLSPRDRSLFTITTLRTVVVVGDGAVGLTGALAAKQLGAARISTTSSHSTRRKLTLEFGATDIVAERGDDGVQRIKELTDGHGVHSVPECVGNPRIHAAGPAPNPPRRQHRLRRRPTRRPHRRPRTVPIARRPTRRPRPVHAYLPELIDLVLAGRINPSTVFDLTLPLDAAAEASRAMDERRAIKALLRP